MWLKNRSPESLPPAPLQRVLSEYPGWLWFVDSGYVYAAGVMLAGIYNGANA
jgi:hypothetical protein